MFVDEVVDGFRRRRLPAVFSDSPYVALGVAALSVRWGFSLRVVFMGSCAGLCVRGF